MHFGTFLLATIALVASIDLLQRPEKQRQLRDAWLSFRAKKPRPARLPRPVRKPHWRIRLAIWYVKYYGRPVLKHVLKLTICGLIFWASYQTFWWLDRNGLIYPDNTFTTQTADE